MQAGALHRALFQKGVEVTCTNAGELLEILEAVGYTALQVGGSSRSGVAEGAFRCMTGWVGI